MGAFLPPLSAHLVYVEVILGGKGNQVTQAWPMRALPGSEGKVKPTLGRAC